MLISIIVPAYNVEHYIERTIESLENQTINKFELIIVNDGSKDRTLEVITSKLMFSKIQSYRIINQENKGVSIARNRGLNECSGKYVLFLDGDDTISNSFVEDLNKILIENDPDILCYGYNKVNIENKLIAEYYDDFGVNKYLMTGVDALNKVLVDRKLHIWTGSIIFRRELITSNELLFYPGCVNGEDQEFINKALLISNNVIYYRKVLSSYLIRGGSVTNRYDISRFDSVYAMKRLFDYIENHAKYSLTKITSEVKSTKILESYFYNLDSCINYEDVKKQKSNINKIIYDIDTIYLNLTLEIKEIIKKVKYKNNIKQFFKIKLFLYYPNLYYYYIKKVKDSEN